MVAGAVSVLHAIEARRIAAATWSDVIDAVGTGLLVVFVLAAAWVATVVTVIPTLF
jgi:hypothetical protein